MDDIKAKQQLLEKIKSATNILVTVSDNPTVDALSAAIGLTLLFDKMDKHATAVFSGVVPPAIAFLEPEKILDDTTDSLRDFIIALDKEKADHLRYKVDGDAVKIFITPYKTTITSDDLEFSQGDYNVELVIALGVDDQDHLDKALDSHGKILHDATVATITAGDQTSSLGGIDWHDGKASSLSEMLAGLTEALKSEKSKSLMNAQIATAYLTGIVAQTERFSNRNTTSKVMTVASQLMAAGADQQLIATKLDEPQQSYPDPVEEDIDEPEPVDTTDSMAADGTLRIGKHKDEETKDIDDEPRVPSHAFETLEEMDTRVKEEERAEATEKAEAALSDLNKADSQSGPVPVASTISPAIPQNDIDSSPSFGGTLNATTEQAEDDARREQEDDQNKTILHHSYLQPSEAAPTTPGSEAVSPTEDNDNAYAFDASSTAPVAPTLPQPPTTPQQENLYQAPEEVPAPVPAPEPVPAPQPEPIQLEPVQPPQPPQPVDLGLPMPPPLPDFSQGLPPAPTLAGPYAPPSDQQPPAILGDILAEAPQQPQPETPPSQPSGPYAPPSTSNDPAQFKIPGQQ